MNLKKLFPLQKELDSHIVKEKGLEGQDLLDKKILALQVELGELANEHRGFKFWSEDQEPDIKKCHACRGLGEFEYLDFYPENCSHCEGTGIEGGRVLEEYVDCLHFILSIGNDLEFSNVRFPDNEEVDDFIDVGRSVSHQLNLLMSLIGRMYFKLIKEEIVYFTDYYVVVGAFISLYKMLGFNWKQIEQAYLEKNKINHERQQNGY